MKYGHFNDSEKEYVIHRPDTPLPWINYLGTDNFFGIISNTAGGYCFYQDAKLRRLIRYRYNNIPMDSNGRYLYIRDGNTTWNPMWKPMRVALDKYECRHGLGYTKITGIKNDLEVSILFFIPINSRNEIWQVQINNHSLQKKEIRLWSFIEWCLWDAYDDMTNFQRNYSIGQVEIDKGTIFHKTEYRERRNHYAYFSSSEKVSGFDTSRDEFIGVHNGLEAPQAVLEGNCKNSIAHGWLPIGAHQIDIELQPGESKDLNFILGYAENPIDNKFNEDGSIIKDEFEKVRSHFSDSKKIKDSFNELKKYWDDLLLTYQAETPDPVVDRMANIWNQYQCMVTFNMSRSASLYESGIGRGMGYRDSNQDILGFVHMIPSKARQRILDIASTQLSDGTCYHQYQPLTKKGNSDIGGGFNDDPLWLILSTSAYIKETGDTIILKEKIGFAAHPPAPSQREGENEQNDFGWGTADPTLYELLKNFAEKNRDNPTKAELILWEQLKTKNLEGYKFRRQHIIGSYITDFVCLSKNLIIEIDGLIHQLPENKESDEIRTAWLQGRGYKVIRFKNEEVINEIDKVLDNILENLKSSLSQNESISKEVLPFGEDLGGATLLDHLHISLQYTLNNLGPHGLPLIGHADWNDCLNLNCFSTEPGESFQLAGHIENDRVAESVMIAGLFCRACIEMSGILNYIGEKEEARNFVKHYEKMKETIYEYGWDGEWFLRAYDARGNKVGSKENKEGKIFIESQGWGIIGGTGLENGYAEKCLNSVNKLLATSNGIILQQPAFQTYYINLR